MTDTKNTGVEAVRWDLSFLYSGTDDPRLDADLDAWCDRARKFHADRKGRLATDLGPAIEDQIALVTLAHKIGVYLFLRGSLDTGDAAVKAKSALVDDRMATVSGDFLTFFEHELVALDEAAIAAQAAASPTVKKHLPWIEDIRRFKPHLLDEPVEAALTKRAPFGVGSWAEFFDELESDLRFPWDGQQKTLPEVLHALTESKDANVRAAALKAVNDGLGGHFAKYSAQTLWMIVGKHAVECRERGYAHPMDAANKGARIPDAVVDALHAAVLDAAAPLAQRFYRLKAAHLGLPTLRWSDRNAPMPFADTTAVPWDKAVETVLGAYGSFSPTLARLVRETIDKRRIDAPPMPSKRGGAYNYSFGMPSGDPVSFTFMTYLGSNRDVMTLAHELGHGVHGLLAGEAQGPLMQQAPTPYAETASVFGEMTTFNHLRATLASGGDAKTALALVIGKLDDIMNTVVRQISFSEFERRVHGWDPVACTWTPARKHSAEELDALWGEVTRQFYGEDGETFTYDDTSHLWSYISHFHRPFYVYGYAFGELLTQSLYAKRAELGDRFEPMYLDLLRAGGTKDAVELTAPFGLDPTGKSFWTDGIRVGIAVLLEEAERLSKDMHVSAS